MPRFTDRDVITKPTHNVHVQFSQFSFQTENSGYKFKYLQLMRKMKQPPLLSSSSVHLHFCCFASLKGCPKQTSPGKRGQFGLNWTKEHSDFHLSEGKALIWFFVLNWSFLLLLWFSVQEIKQKLSTQLKLEIPELWNIA